MSEQTCSSQRPQSESKGKVVALDGQHVLVKLAPQGCGRCHEPGGCGGQSLTQMLSSEKVYRVRNTIGAREGDTVVLLLDSELIRQAAWLAYGLPLVLCLAGAILGQLLAGDLMAFGGALLGLLLGWWALRQHSNPSTGNSTNSTQLSIRFDHLS